MTQCKNPTCQNEVVSIEGRRPKEFCSVTCRTKYHNSKNAKGTGRGRPKGSKNRDKVVVSVDPIKYDVDSPTVMSVTKEGLNGEPIAVYHSRKEEIVDTAIINQIAEHYSTTPIKETKWDFSKKPFLVVEDFTEYPSTSAPKEGFQRKEWLAKKKIADDKIREAYHIYKSQNK